MNRRRGHDARHTPALAAVEEDSAGQAGLGRAGGIGGLESEDGRETAAAEGRRPSGEDQAPRVVWVLIDYSNGYWIASGIEGLRLHGSGHGELSYSGTGVETYGRLQDDIIEVYLRPQFPTEDIIPMWLHTNSAKSRYERACAEEAKRERAA